MKNLNKIKSLIKRECANFNYENCTCYPMDAPCHFYSDIPEDAPPVRCKYFEQGVLPLDIELEFGYRNERELAISENIDKCEMCGTFIKKSSNRQKYCNKCKSGLLREQKRKWASENREK